MSEVNEEIKEETKEPIVEEVEVKTEETSEETTEARAEVVADEEAPEEKNEEDSFKDKFYYLAAEMENMKKRNERERQNLLKYGNEKVLKGLIDVVDNLDRTLGALENDEDEKVKNIVTGINMVRTQFMDVLTSNGLEELDSLGKTFDPNFHEAMAQQPAEGKEDDEIIQEYQKGYVLNGRLLRAAKVVIVKN